MYCILGGGGESPEPLIIFVGVDNDKIDLVQNIIQLEHRLVMNRMNFLLVANLQPDNPSSGDLPKNFKAPRRGLEGATPPAHTPLSSMAIDFNNTKDERTFVSMVFDFTQWFNCV